MKKDWKKFWFGYASKNEKHVNLFSSFNLIVNVIVLLSILIFIHAFISPLIGEIVAIIFMFIGAILLTYVRWSERLKDWEVYCAEFDKTLDKLNQNVKIEPIIKHDLKLKVGEDLLCILKFEDWVEKKENKTLKKKENKTLYVTSMGLLLQGQSGNKYISYHKTLKIIPSPLTLVVEYLNGPCDHINIKLSPKNAAILYYVCHNSKAIPKNAI